MQITHHAFDVASWRKNGVDPAHIFKRESPSARWLVATSAVDVASENSAVGWAVVADGDLVYVPLMRYLTVNDGAAAVGFAASVAAALPLKLLDKLRYTPRRLHVVFGNVVENDVTGGNVPVFAIYLGFAFQLNA